MNKSKLKLHGKRFNPQIPREELLQRTSEILEEKGVNHKCQAHFMREISEFAINSKDPKFLPLHASIKVRNETAWAQAMSIVEGFLADFQLDYTHDVLMLEAGSNQIQEDDSILENQVASDYLESLINSHHQEKRLSFSQRAKTFIEDNNLNLPPPIDYSSSKSNQNKSQLPTSTTQQPKTNKSKNLPIRQATTRSIHQSITTKVDNSPQFVSQTKDSKKEPTNKPNQTNIQNIQSSNSTTDNGQSKNQFQQKPPPKSEQGTLNQRVNEESTNKKDLQFGTQADNKSKNTPQSIPDPTLISKKEIQPNPNNPPKMAPKEIKTSLPSQNADAEIEISDDFDNDEEEDLFEDDSDLPIEPDSAELISPHLLSQTQSKDIHPSHINSEIPKPISQEQPKKINPVFTTITSTGSIYTTLQNNRTTTDSSHSPQNRINDTSSSSPKEVLPYSGGIPIAKASSIPTYNQPISSKGSDSYKPTLADLKNQPAPDFQFGVEDSESDKNVSFSPNSPSSPSISIQVSESSSILSPKITKSPFTPKTNTKLGQNHSQLSLAEGKSLETDSSKDNFHRNHSSLDFPDQPEIEVTFNESDEDAIQTSQSNVKPIENPKSSSDDMDDFNYFDDDTKDPLSPIPKTSTAQITTQSTKPAFNSLQKPKEKISLNDFDDKNKKNQELQGLKPTQTSKSNTKVDDEEFDDFDDFDDEDDDKPNLLPIKSDQGDKDEVEVNFELEDDENQKSLHDNPSIHEASTIESGSDDFDFDT